MKLATWMILSSSLVGCAPRTSSVPCLRLVTWNVHACRGGVDRIVAKLRELNPDVVCLQEVESAELDSPDDHEAGKIARLLGMNHVSAGKPHNDTSEEQIVIMYRGELRDVQELRASRRRYYGVCAKLDWHGREVRIVAIHFTSNATDRIGRFFKTGFRRVKEVWDFVSRSDEWRGDTIVAGDFNAVPAMPELLTVWTRFSWAAYFHPTHPSEHPVLQLDHVFWRGPWQAGQIKPEPTVASDHWPLVATLQCTALAERTDLSTR